VSDVPLEADPADRSRPSAASTSPARMAQSLDRDALMDRVSHVVGSRIEEFAPLPGGASSLTYAGQARSGSDSVLRFVVKVAPPGLEPIGNRDVLRQALILKALANQQSVPVPAVLFEDRGRPPEVPPLFGMQYIDGEVFEPLAEIRPTPLAPEFIQSRAHHGVEILGGLHRLNPVDLGLGDEVPVALDSEVSRWRRLLHSIRRDASTLTDRTAAALLSSLPSSMPLAVCHGDYRLGNTLSERDHVNAVIDWELWSVGDPRLDLAYFLRSCDIAEREGGSDDVEMPSRGSLLAKYEQAYGRSIRELLWFEALCRFKAAAIASYVMKLNSRQERVHPRVAAWTSEKPLSLLEQALERLDPILN
jgi:aminoglycoside phosphotransferase (APT) family kinase protein